MSLPGATDADYGVTAASGTAPEGRRKQVEAEPVRTMRAPGSTSAARPHPPAPHILHTLAFGTGVVDGVSFLALGGVFAAMMSGNVIFLGLRLSDSIDSSALGPLLAIVAYVVASAFAATLARRSAGPAFGTRGSNAVEVLLLTAAALVAAATTVDPDGASGYTVLMLLAAAMSWRATNVRTVGSVNVPTVVLNLTLIAGPATAGDGLAGRGDLGPRAIAFAMFLLGALAGGLLHKIELWVPLALAVVLAIVVAVALERERGMPPQLVTEH